MGSRSRNEINYRNEVNYLQSLSVRYRPKTYDECIGQYPIIQVLRRQVSTNNLKHAYLFCGSSGCGKTTIARIFANEINNGIGNPIEIDGASNNGVDNVREIIKQAQERSLSGTYKIYIIDECHALSNAAWQAFLKCIEETPEYTIFIFCTTDPQKIPPTIINRCMRFNFTRLNPSQIKDRLDTICNLEHLSNFENVTDYVSKICKGQMRDAISYLEQIIDYDNNLTLENAFKALGTVDITSMFNLINAILDGKEAEVLSILANYYENNTNLALFIDEFIAFILDLLKYNYLSSCSGDRIFDIIKIPNTYIESIKNVLNITNVGSYYQYVVNKLLELKNMLKNDPEPYSTIQVLLLQITRCQ